MTAQFQNKQRCIAVIKHFLVVLAASLILTRIWSEDTRGVDYCHEIIFPDFTLYGEHAILLPSRHLISACRQHMLHCCPLHVFLNFRIFLGVKPIFRPCPSLTSSQLIPPKLDFGSALFFILLSGHVQLNLSSIFPCGYCETRSHGNSVKFAVIVVICGFTTIVSTWDLSSS